MRRSITFFLIIVMLLQLTACAATNSGEYDPQDEVLQYWPSTPVATVDPSYAATEAELQAVSRVFEGLVRLEGDEVAAALASSWQVSEDGRVYTFDLRDDVSFHNGRPVTAADCKFSFERQLRLNTPYSWIFNKVVGADAVLANTTNDLAGVTAADDYTLVVRLNKADDGFLRNLTLPAAAVLDRYELVAQGTAYGKSGSLPSGTGPYRVAEFVSGNRLVLGSYQGYYAGEVSPSRVEYDLASSKNDAMLLLQTGKMDMVEDAFSWPDTAGFSVLSPTRRNITYLGVNQSLFPFNNSDLASMVFAAVSGEDVAKAARDGHAVVCHGSFMANWQNPAAAKTASQQVDVDAVRLSVYTLPLIPALTLACGPSAEDKRAAEAVAQALTSCGITTTVASYGAQELVSKIRSGEIAFYLRTYVDMGGGRAAFFYDAAREAGIADYAAAERRLFEQGRLYCLYYKTDHTAAAGIWQKLGQ